MAINLVTQFLPYVDEIFKKESKKELVTNQDFDWTGAHTIKVYKISTGTMNDYDRAGTGSGAKGSRYGSVQSLDATTEEFTLKKDRSFTFAIDKLDSDETAQQLAGASALARQQREVVIPEVDAYVYGVMAAGAGTKPAAVALTEDNIYDEITKATNKLDNEEVPDENRAIIVTPDVYRLMKKSKDITMETDVDSNLRKQGVVSNLDGASVIKVPASRLPENFGFMMCHPCATVAPTKLEDYKIHQDPPGISGSLVEGRICYDAFILDNKKMAIYYQETAKA
nr:MAG TPA: major capsid protein [Caudoviricetes sp.]